MGKTIKSRIKRFCAKYPEPRQYKITLHWKRKDGEHSAVVGSGEDLYSSLYGRYTYDRCVGKPLYIQHYRYDDETELMECSYAVISCLTPKKNEERHWQYAERYFIPKEEKQVYDINGNTNGYKVHASYTWHANTARGFLQAFVRLACPRGVFEEAFKGLTDDNPILPPRYMSHTNVPWILTEWIKYNSIPRDLEKGKTQQRLNKVLNRELEDINLIQKKVNEYITNKSKSKYRYSYFTIAYFDKPAKAFRIFREVNDTLQEMYRVYIDGKKFLFANNKTGKWITNGSFNDNQFYTSIINMNDVYSLPHCGYIEAMECDSVYKVVSIMRNPEIEQLCNMGFAKMAKRICHYDYITRGLRVYLDEPDKKKKNVCARYHLTKNQLGVINDNIDTNTNYWGQEEKLKNIKWVLGVDDLSHIDIDSFRKYYNVIEATYKMHMFNAFGKENRKKLFIRIANMQATHSNAFTLFYDTWVNARNNVNINILDIRSYNELIRAHDTAIELERIRREEQHRLWNMAEAERHKELEKKMVKIDEEREFLNYEEEEFIIRLPKNLSEIVNEGHALRHCVGGYTANHANGNTTIMFLRRKSEIDKPFYTIEVRNKNIAQIHGFGNRWLGNNPEAIPTVARWLKANDIHCDNKILLCTATGYGGNNDLIPMPAF